MECPWRADGGGRLGGTGGPPDRRKPVGSVKRRGCGEGGGSRRRPIGVPANRRRFICNANFIATFIMIENKA